MRWHRASTTLWRSGYRSVVLLPAGAEQPFVLNGSAAAIWDGLCDPISPDELARKLAARYATKADAIRTDVEGALRDLAALGAIRPE